MRFKAVFFDMDGLMFDTERLCGSLWVKYGPQFGLPMTLEDVGLMRGRNAADCRAAFLERYGKDAPYDAICNAIHQEFYEMVERDLPILPGLHELLDHLKSLDIPRAVVSSTRKSQVEHYLQLAGIGSYFDELICGDMVEHSKPNPDIYCLAAKTFGVSPSQCLVLEDSYNGIRAGHAAGCFTVMVPNLDPPTEEMHQLADRIVHSLYDVIPLVEQ